MSLVKSAKKKAIEEAKRAARDMGSEIREIPKSVPSQVVGEKKAGGSGLFSKNTSRPKIKKPEVIDVSEEIKKFPKDFKNQLFGTKDTQTSKQDSPIVEAMLQRTESGDDQASAGRSSEMIEQEIAQARKQRLEKEKQIEEQKEQELRSQDMQKDERQAVAPPSGPQKGPPRPGQKGPKSPETRKSKH